MKNRFLMSLLLAACVSLSAASVVSNANFTAVASANGNVFTMGTVALQSNGQSGQAINMDKLFSSSKNKFDQVSTTTAQLLIKGDLPVTLSAAVTGATLPSRGDEHEIYNLATKSFSGFLTDYFANNVNVKARWWRQYKMAISATVTRPGGSSTTVTSRELTSAGENGFDSFFDTLSGTTHAGSANTVGISSLFSQLGTLNPGDLVTITTQIKLVSELKDDGGVTIGILNPEQQNIFQGLSLGADVNIIATQA